MWRENHLKKMGYSQSGKGDTLDHLNFKLFNPSFLRLKEPSECPQVRSGNNSIHIDMCTCLTVNSNPSY
jgi:hypothetical protein